MRAPNPAGLIQYHPNMKQEPPSNYRSGAAVAGEATSEFGNPTQLRRSLDALATRIDRTQENLHRAITIARPLLTADPRDLPYPEMAETMKSPPAAPYTMEIQALAAKLEHINHLLHELGSHLDT
jgi:hypothetical protein